MKLKKTLIIVVLSFVGGAVLLLGSVQQETAKELLEKAIYFEDVQGDLDKAIEVYSEILNNFAQNSEVAARALYRLGWCHERLGNQEARNAYRRIIDEYPGQKEQVAQARVRLAELDATAANASRKPTFRKINLPNRIPPDAQLSPDGKSIAFVNNEWLWIAPTSSNLGSGFLGTPRQLDTHGITVEFCGFIWSGDGKWIAFNSGEVEGGYKKIYIVPAGGGKPMQIHRNDRDVRVVNYRMSLSPNGDTIVFSSKDEDTLHIYKKSVTGGSPERLVDVPAREPVFSPDGKMIAYVEDKQLVGRHGGGLWVIPVEKGSPTLVADAGNASSPIWSPDGKMIAFVDYDANDKIHIVRLGPDGKTAGEKISIDCPEGTNGVGRLTGWTPDNKIGILVGIPTEFALYTQPVEGGTATFVTHGGYPLQPRWSPDGKRIFHTNKVDEISGDWVAFAIAFVPAEGGEVTTIPLHSEAKIRLPGYGLGDLISPDGKTLVFAGYKSVDPITIKHIWTLPVDGETPTQLTDEPVIDGNPCWSPDGKEIAFVRNDTPSENWAGMGKDNIYIIPASGGEPRRITSESDRVFGGPVLWSPDGKLLAYFSRDEDSVDGTIKIIPANGGEPQVIAKVLHIYANKEMAWSPDGRRIAFNAHKPGSSNTIISNFINIVSLEDGSIEEIEPNLKDVNEIYHLDWSPDGKTLVFGGYTGGGHELWFMEGFMPLVKR